ncbi:hypothetical protein P3X46_011864 [Hevea brasiliensis]|uniref:Uncharacterized protein n=1 Tax=Hevea brasiliensis TaxID=3981 RepID=A0ABQ9MAQ9_HEVBR|nr:hypothetical protein P3X46_011864 [Hevea brasiliensis]
MDIEPLWTLGGWFLFSICMAKPNSKLPISETNTKSHHFFLLFALLIFIFLLLISPTKPTKQSTMGSSISFKRLLLESSSESTSTTMTNLHPKQSQSSHDSSSTKSRGSVFGAKAHEVPSGPNPISNR